MIHTVELDDDTSELLQAHSALIGLTISELIDCLLSVHLEPLHGMLALVDEHPQLREQTANLLQSFGPESLMRGIKRVAPAGYETAGERFERELGEVIGALKSPHH